MNLSPELQRRIDNYLHEVETHLAGKTPAARDEVISGLRDHMHEALLRHGATPTMSELDKIIGNMDAPESFAENEADTAVPKATRSGSSNRWFLLALAFLALNGYGVWRLTSPTDHRQDSTSSAAATNEAIAHAEPLQLIAIDQIDISADREVSLIARFNAPPYIELIPNFLRISSTYGINYQVSNMHVSKWDTNAVLIRTEPVYNDTISYLLAAGLPSDLEIPPTSQDYQGDIKLQVGMKLSRIEAVCPPFESPSIRAGFSSFADAHGLEDYIDVDPDINFTIDIGSGWLGSDIILRGDFKPGRVYTVTYKEGLPAINGSKLEEPIKRSVQIPNRSAALQIENPGRFLSPQGSLALPIASVNLPSWTASLHPVFKNNLVQLALRENHWFYRFEGPATDLTAPPIVITNTLESRANEVQRSMLRLRDLSTVPLRGAYWLHIAGEKNTSASRLMVVTDLGISTRAYKGGLLAWINSLSNATAIASARVTVYARNNQIIAEGQTDDRGLVKLEHATDAQPYLIVAEKDDDLSLISLDQTPLMQGASIQGPAFLPPDGIEAAVFTERGVYRPGEKVFMQAIARDHAMNAPRPFPALFRVMRPDGRVFKDEPVMLNESGSAHAEMTLPEFLPTGRYSIQLVMPGTFTLIGETELALEDFVPPQIRVDVESSARRGKPGAGSTFDVHAMHLFGSAASGLKVSGYATVKASPFVPTNWPGWSFGDDEKVFSSIFLSLGSQSLDPEGRAEFYAETSDAWRPPASLEVVHQAVVLESGGRSVTAYGSEKLDPYPFYVGIRKNWDGVLRVGETQRVQIATVTPDGDATQEKHGLVIELYRAHWNSVLRQNSDNRYTWVSERQLTRVLEDTISMDAAQDEWTFAVESAGDYLLLVRHPSSGAATRIAFGAASPEQEWVEWSREKPGIVDLQLDRERYHPGETARVMVKAPFRGTALMTIESDSLREERIIVLDKNTAEIEIPIRADYYPNVYCTFTLLRPARAERVWSTHRAIGAIAIPVSPTNRNLRVSIDAPGRMLPQSSLDTLITVTDESGQPATGEITLMAVDEGICMLTTHETPDPNRIFNTQRGLASQAFDIYNELIRIVDDQIEGASTSGGDMDSGLRRRLNPIKANRFKPTALWHTPVKLDANGQARIQLNVPEFTGELRLMAVAANATQAGSAEKAIQVKRDLIAQPSLPRFLAVGDRSEASMLLLNESDQPTGARVMITCGGPLRVETSEYVIALAAKSSTNITMSLVAGPGIGKANCRIEVQSGSSIYAESIELAVRPAGGTRIAAAHHTIQPGEAITLSPPKTMIPETIRLSGAVSGRPSLQFARALDYVVRYPYGCLEQTVSGAFPLLYAPSWLDSLPPGASAIGDSAGIIKSAIMRVISMQQAEGGFALWPFDRRIDNAASFYAIHFLIEARNSGYPVPDASLNDALQWLRNRLDRSTVTDADSPGWKIDMGERAAMAYLLTLAGTTDAGWNGRLREISSRLNYADQVRIASALLLSGEPREAVSMLGSLGMPTQNGSNTNDYLASDIRDAALLMSAWLDVEPGHPAVIQLGQYLESQMHEGHWGTTHDNAMALLAFGKYAARVNTQPQHFNGAIQLPDGRREEISDAAEFKWSLENAGIITISNSGPGLMYAWSHIEGAGNGPEPAIDNGVVIRRATLDFFGEPLDATTRKRGDMIIVRLSVDTQGRQLDQLVIEDLLPAGWEIENPRLATSQQFGWITERDDAARHREARDDRMLIFTGSFSGTRDFFYATRAVSAGEFTLPPVTISGMYDPQIRSVSGGATIRVNP